MNTATKIVSTLYKVLPDMKFLYEAHDGHVAMLHYEDTKHIDIADRLVDYLLKGRQY